MRIFDNPGVSLPYMVAIAAIAAQAAYSQPPLSPRNVLLKIGDVPVAEVLERLGAKLEPGAETKELDAYSSHFDRTDPNRDGKHTKEEYVDKGGYMTPQARAGIFRAADGNADGVVTKAEYVLNRIITDEAKVIVGGMDDDNDGLVERAEFVNHAAKLLSDRGLAEQVYAAFDANADGGITIPEYLRVWGQWARAGRKPAEERIAARRAELADTAKKPGSQSSRPGQRRPGGGPPSGRPGAGAGPPSVDVIFERFDGNKDGKLQKEEVPVFVRQFILPADADGDRMVTKEELQASRQRQRPGDRPAGNAPRKPNRQDRAKRAAGDQPISLFDGKSFQGWEGNLDAFRIEAGAIVGGSLTKPIPRNDYLCSKKTYADFELRLKFKVLGEGANAGIQIRSERVPNSNEMIGYQADLGDKWWGCLYDERRHKLLTGPPEQQRSKIIRRNDWNEYVIRCQGRRVQLWINGHQTVVYTEPDESIPQVGVIGLQIHVGPPSEAWYKDIELVKLPPAN
ncbi:MAG: family 16 glycoside hydrolase [Planctomycetota bacterium]|jgi:Ca2+-binding EF-hand superfamily protein